ncbi:MAG: SNF2-related protein [bacterium]
MNPHQVEAALFAFRSPLSKGAILADEVGLGKTIEAGILLSQKWAERKRKLLIIVPANLRKQWSQELSDKFFLPSVILEAKSFNGEIAQGNLNPFQQESVVIVSYQFVRNKAPYVRQIEWDLVVIDEAHRLRNVYKPTNKIANAIKEAVARHPKVLLTATPLQNSLLELYGLVSVVDEYTFGDISSFKNQFTRANGEEDGFANLRDRLRPICKRTLRNQVLEYIKYTNRHALVQEFVPTEEEQRLYDLVSEYLQRPALYALPSSQRQLMTLILRKLLASSTYAISHTLEGLANKLDEAARQHNDVTQPPEGIEENFENYDELEDEWEEDDESTAKPKKQHSSEEWEGMSKESVLLREFHSLAKSIIKNSKGEVLLTALKRGFAKARELGSPEKAIIFTESRRTQEYLYALLERTEFAGKIVLFNGSNNDPKSKEIYQHWLEKHKGSDRVTGSATADKRAAIVDYFRDEAVIMIATEAAAEGINLQFCNLVMNYDLPWNPQRIEQRIGRCHRYGQKYDVVVINFLNKKNAADQRVYQLLAEKFRLFDGVFGSSDEVLGAIESGVDFEKRIANICQKCRTEQQIEFEFDTLQQELQSQIDEGKRVAHEKLLNNFDQEVVEKVRLDSKNYLDKYEDWLWQLTRFFLKDYADFSDGDHTFVLQKNPFERENIHPGPYHIGRNVEDANLYRVGHPLAQRIIEQCKKLPTDAQEVTFDYSGQSSKTISILKPYVGKSGWLLCSQYTLSAFETEDHLLFAGMCDDATILDEEQCRRLFLIPATTQALDDISVLNDTRSHLQDRLEPLKEGIKEKLGQKNTAFFEVEVDKLDRWGEDRRNALKSALKELEETIRVIKREARLTSNLPERLELEKRRRQLESKRDDAWKEYEQAARGIEESKDKLLDETQKRLKQSEKEEELFLIRWRLV